VRVGRAAGAVLAGGASRRMGSDKAALRHGGRALARRVTDDLAAHGLEPVALVGSPAPGALDLAPGVAVVADLHPGEGPLGGILTALEWSPAACCVVVPCDVVRWEPASLVPLLLAGVDVDADVDVAVLTSERGPEPLYACWRRAALPCLRAAFADGVRAPTDVLARLRVAAVRVPPGDVPVSVNTRTEAAAAGLDVGPTDSRDDREDPAGMHQFGGDDR
jgi:molybdopterin-guanine dinucleotide biosynthesis protein A